MTKTKTPFLSMGSTGSIGNVLTTQKHHQSTIVRSKPMPEDPKSLNQMYQRWLYQDYTHMWADLSADTQKLYKRKGYPYNMTGFNAWMRYSLNKLPDIAALWRLDELSGAVVVDSSRNSNTGTIFEAVPAVGLISGGRYFDGVDDKITFPSSPTLQLLSPLSIECFVYPTLEQQGILNHLIGYNRAYQLSYHHVVGPTFLVDTVGGIAYRHGTIVPYLNWYHLCGTYNGINQAGVHIYINGELADRTLTGACSGNIEDTAGQPFIISGIGGRRFAGIIDHMIVYNRELTASEIKRHSLRRYPLK